MRPRHIERLLHRLPRSVVGIQPHTAVSDLTYFFLSLCEFACNLEPSVFRRRCASGSSEGCGSSPTADRPPAQRATPAAHRLSRPLRPKRSDPTSALTNLRASCISSGKAGRG
jgi:hypothetical protein